MSCLVGLRRRCRLLLVVALLVTGAAATLAGSGSAAAATVPSGFHDSTVLAGLTSPTVVQFASDGRIFVAQQNGVIKAFQNLSDTHPVTFADLSAEVDDFWDRGLLGMALAPDFPTDPYLYVLYTRDAPIGGVAPAWHDGCPTPPGPNTDGCVVSARVARLQASGNVMTGAEQVLIDGWCQQFPSHSIGTLLFGRDGYLYISGGDGASYTHVDYGQYGARNYAGDQANPCADPPAAAGNRPDTADCGGRCAPQPERAAHRWPRDARWCDPASRSGHRRRRAGEPVLLLLGPERPADCGLRAAESVPIHPASEQPRAVDRRRGTEQLGRNRPCCRTG